MLTIIANNNPVADTIEYFIITYTYNVSASTTTGVCPRLQDVVILPVITTERQYPGLGLRFDSVVKTFIRENTNRQVRM